VTITIIDLLEMININHQRGEGMLIAPRLFKRLLAQKEQMPPIEHAGQRISIL